MWDVERGTWNVGCGMWDVEDMLEVDVVARARGQFE